MREVKQTLESDTFADIVSIMESHMHRCTKVVGTCKCTEIGEYMNLIKYAETRGNKADQIIMTYKKLAKKFTIVARELERQHMHANAALQSLAKDQIQGGEEQLDVLEDQQQAQAKEDKLIMLSVQVIKRRLFAILMSLFCSELYERVPKSLKMYLVNCYIQATLMRRPFLCLNVMRSFDSKGLSTIDKISKSINDLYILTRLGFIEGGEAGVMAQFDKDHTIFLASQHSKRSIDESQDGRLDIDHFIELDQVKGKFNVIIENLRGYAIDFWCVFQVKSSNIDFRPKHALKIGYRLAEEIKTLHYVFSLIEKKSVKKDPQVYEKFARVELHIMNDVQSYTELMSKMKSIQEIRKIENDTKGGKVIGNFDEEVAFMIVSGSLKYMGQIMMLNQACAAIAGLKKTKTESKAALNINALMPRIVEAEHDRFIREFCMHGDSTVLNRSRVSLVMNVDGILLLGFLRVRMHYSQLYGYCYFGTAIPISHLTPFKYGSSYPVAQLIFLTFNCKDGRFYEFSGSFMQLLVKYNVITPEVTAQELKDKLVDDNKLTLDDILEGFCLHNYEHQQQNNLLKDMDDMHPLSYEGLHTIDLQCIKASLFTRNTQSMPNPRVRLSIRIEQYAQGSVEMGVAIMVLDENTPQEGENKDQQQTNPHGSKAGSAANHNSDSNDNHDLLDEQDQYMDMEVGSASASSVSMPADGGFSMQKINTYNSAFAFPQSLRIVLQLVLFLFAVAFAISSINMALNIQNKNYGLETVIAVRQSINRVNFTSTSRLILRIMINIANGFEPTSSQIIADRWGFYSAMMATIIDLLKRTQNFLDNTNEYKVSLALRKIMDTPSLQIQSLNGQNTISIQNATLSQAQNLYQSKMTYLNTGSMDQYRGNLWLHTFDYNRSKEYKPNENEQMVFFGVINGNRVIRQYNWVQTNQQLIDAKLTSDEYTKLTLITTMISVFSILIVLLIIAPIISKSEERRYLALTFFVLIPEEKRREIIQECKDFKLFPDEEPPKPANHLSNNSMISDSFSSGHLMKQAEEELKEGENDSMTSLRHMSQRDNLKGSSLKPSKTQRYHNMRTKVRATVLASKKFSKKKSQLDDVFEESVDSAQSDPKKQGSQSDLGQPISLGQLAGNNQGAEEEDSENDAKSPDLIQIITRYAFKQKMKRVLSILLMMIIFAAYFTGSYLMATENYRVSAQSVMDLNTILFKEACFENMITFIRENQIRNESVVLSEDNKTVASVSLIKSCQDKEKAYGILRKVMPSYLKGAERLMNDFETRDFCEKVFGDEQLPLRKQRCQIALNGLLNMGLSNALSYMYRQAQKIQMRFDNANQKGGRTYEFLRESIPDNETVEMIDVKLYLFSKAFEDLKNASVESVQEYFNVIMNQMVALYVAFVIFLAACLVGFLFVIFKGMKESTWNTNLILRIIPAHDCLDKSQRHKMQSFFTK